MYTVGDWGGVHRIQTKLLSIGPNNMCMHYYVISDIEGQQAYIITFSVGGMGVCGGVWIGVWVGCVCMGDGCVWVRCVWGGVCVCVF